MKNPIENSVSVKEPEIRVAAYQLWEKAGHPAGRDLQFWLDAEKQLRAAAQVASAVPAAPLSSVTSQEQRRSQTATNAPA